MQAGADPVAEVVAAEAANLAARRLNPVSSKLVRALHYPLLCRVCVFKWKVSALMLLLSL